MDAVPLYFFAIENRHGKDNGWKEKSIRRSKWWMGKKKTFDETFLINFVLFAILSCTFCSSCPLSPFFFFCSFYFLQSLRPFASAKRS